MTTCVGSCKGGINVATEWHLDSTELYEMIHRQLRTIFFTQLIYSMCIYRLDSIRQITHGRPQLEKVRVHL